MHEGRIAHDAANSLGLASGSQLIASLEDRTGCWRQQSVTTTRLRADHGRRKRLGGGGTSHLALSLASLRLSCNVVCFFPEQFWHWTATGLLDWAGAKSEGRPGP